MVSVIVPAYNCVNSLAYCVHSIQQQTFSDWELILVDDGSTDGSNKLCDKFAAEDNRIRVIHKPNGGVSSARNTGIDAVSGEYITFCDSDDYLEPDYLEMLLQAARSNPEYGHIWCCFQTVTGYQKENATPNFTSSEPVLHYILQDYMTLHEMWLDAEPWNKLYQADIVRTAKIRFPEDMSLGEDWLFNFAYIDASANKRIVVVTKPLYNYMRGNEESLDSKYRTDILNIYRRLSTACFAHLRKWMLPENQIKKFYNNRFYLYEKILRNTMRAPNKTEREKIKWNNMFMRSAEFREVLRARDCFVHPLYLIGYWLGDFSLILVCDHLSKLKNDMSKIIIEIL